MRGHEITKFLGHTLLLGSITGVVGCQNPGTTEELDLLAMEASCEALWAAEARDVYDDCRDTGLDSERCQSSALRHYEAGTADNCRPCEATCALEARLEFDLCREMDERSDLCGHLSLDVYNTCTEGCSEGLLPF